MSSAAGGPHYFVLVYRRCAGGRDGDCRRDSALARHVDFARAHSRSGRTRIALAGACVATFAAAAAIIYFAVGSRHSLTAQPPMASMGTAAGGSAADASMKSAGPGRSMETEVAALEARLARDGGTSDDWSLLAKAYEFLGRPDDAARARSHIAKPTAGATVSQLSAGALVAAATATETRAPAARPSPPAPAPSLAELETRVKKNPNDVQAWLALAEDRKSVV